MFIHHVVHLDSRAISPHACAFLQRPAILGMVPRLVVDVIVIAITVWLVTAIARFLVAHFYVPFLTLVACVRSMGPGIVTCLKEAHKVGRGQGREMMNGASEASKASNCTRGCLHAGTSDVCAGFASHCQYYRLREGHLSVDTPASLRRTQ